MEKNTDKSTGSRVAGGFQVELFWRGLAVKVQYIPKSGGPGNCKDRVYVKAPEPFAEKELDYLVKWIGPFTDLLTEEEVLMLAEIWLEEQYAYMPSWREAAMKRCQLSLF